ncbi:AAA family ATPase [Microbacterium sp. DT81.1]|uniref:AAA family ATPase n=1 Tax=Microbacterium sp. DT81.1 TaxID=3393413 RepID=UPI003CF02407
MRIHRLEVEGFGPFRDRQSVDFDAFAEEGIFLISGRTGAGKSSILDAVCFALYGNVPRYEEGDKRLRSDHSEPGDPTQVVLEFSTGDRRWRIERSPEFDRLKRRGGGTTIQAPEARMFEWVDGSWRGRAARPRDVGVLLDEILGLNQQQFLQVILLAQNRFARFLLAKNDERQTLLRTLFGTRRFEEYERAFEQRRKDAGEAMALQNQALLSDLEQAEALLDETPLPGAGEGEPANLDLAVRLGHVQQGALRARHIVETATAEEATATAAHAAAEKRSAELLAQAEKQQRRDRSRAALQALEARAGAIRGDRAEFADAQRAEALRPAIDGARKALVALTAATAREASAREAWLAAGEEDAGPTELDALVSTLTREVGEWSAALPAERGIPGAEADVARFEAALALLDARLAEADASRLGLPARIAALDDALADATRAGAGAEDAADRVRELEGRRGAAAEAATLLKAAWVAERAAMDAGSAFRAASAALDELRERRLAGYAGELAEALVAGESCAVCGSLEHPSPAPRGGDPVTPEAIAEAEAAKGAALAADVAATRHLRAAEQATADAAARAGGQSADELDGLLADARGAASAASEAATRAEALRADREALVAEAATLQELRESVAAERSITLAQLAAARGSLEHARRTVEAARGDFAGVGERIRATERRIGLAAELADVLRATARLADAATAAADDLEERLAETGFDDLASATAALREPAVRTALDARIREFDAQLAAEKATLMPLELEMLPEHLIDTEEAATALAVAEALWRSAVTARAQAEQRADVLADAAARAEFAYDAIAALAAEVAVIERLAHTVSGRAPNTRRMKLETFVLAAELEEIVAAANVRLGEMSGERYSLQHSDALAARGAASGLGLEVLDRYTGRPRPAQSLSGGETFLASLALALGLAEVVTGRAGGITLDTLFIDEGFGALDAETLDIAMRTLDELRQGGRTVGVISHVEAMKEQLPAQLLVEVTPEGWSAVRQATLAATY